MPFCLIDLLESTCAWLSLPLCQAECFAVHLGS
jgi:hypothetical protein